MSYDSDWPSPGQWLDRDWTTGFSRVKLNGAARLWEEGEMQCKNAMRTQRWNGSIAFYTVQSYIIGHFSSI